MVLIQRIPLANEQIRDFFVRVKTSPCTLVYDIDDPLFDEERLTMRRGEARLLRQKD